ncbi:MAG TPA: hypothetical protein VEC57_14645 [Candidatus Limnocylindrales bacterium]|nr:hypothetical protein [Candidatus Limnocylindrales bacterium]
MPAANAHAAAQLVPEPTPASNQRARQVAACYGECCPKRGRCVVYRGVELPGADWFVLTCRTPEGAFPLFEDVAQPLPRALDADSEGGEI